MERSIELLHKNYLPLNYHVPISDTCCAMIYKMYENQFIEWLENVNESNVKEIAHFVLGICEVTINNRQDEMFDKQLEKEKETKKKAKNDVIKYKRKKNTEPLKTND